MPITILTPDGQRFIFPDDTPQDTISAAMRKHFGDAPKTDDKPSPGILDTAADMATSIGREFNRNISALPEMAYKGTSALAGLTGYKMMPWEETYAGRAQQHLTRGAPETAAGRYAGAVSGAAGAALPAVGATWALAPRLAAMAPTSTIGAIGQQIGRGITSAPAAAAGADAAAITGAGVAQQGAEDAGASPAVQTIVGMAGGMGAPMLMRPGAPGPAPSVRHAQDKILEAARRDLPDVPADAAGSALATRAQTLMEHSPDARLADAGGENMRTLMRLATDRPNALRDQTHTILDTRAERQWKRLEQGLARIAGSHDDVFTDPRRYFELTDTMASEIAVIGKQRLQPAMAVDTPITPKLAGVLRRPTMQQIFERVSTNIRNEGDQAGPATTTQVLFRMKLELDDLIGAAVKARARGETPTAGWDARTLTILKRDFMNAIDNPALKEGLKEYATKAQLKGALDEGYETFNKLRSDQIRMRVGELRADDPKKEKFFRMGALRAVVDKIRAGNATNDRLKNVFGSPEMRMKLEALLGQNDYPKLLRLLNAESRMVKTREAVKGNSITNRLQMEREAATEPVENAVTAGRAVMDALNMRFAPLAELGMRQTQKARARLIPAETAEEILRILTSRDPQTLARLSSPGRAAPMEPMDARTALINALMAASSGAR